MNQRKQRVAQARDLLALHSVFLYTDDEQNMIECGCGWQSSPFLPEPLMKASEVFAAHQVNVLLQNGVL